MKNPGNKRIKSVHTVYNGHKYDSKREAEFASLLDVMLVAKVIKSWDSQVSFTLPETAMTACGRRKRHRVDFMIETVVGRKIYIEIKGEYTAKANPDGETRRQWVEHDNNIDIHVFSTPTKALQWLKSVVMIGREHNGKKTLEGMG